MSTYLTKATKRSLSVPFIWLGLAAFLGFSSIGSVSAECTNSDLNVMILGSGGPELAHNRASSGYLVREGKRAKFIIDMGSGTMSNFVRGQASTAEPLAVLFTHLHVDHSVDFPSWVKASYFEGREKPLYVFGPSGNDYLPPLESWLSRLFSASHGVYPYLSEYIDPQQSPDYEIIGKTLSVKTSRLQKPEFPNSEGFQLSAIAVSHGPIPALAWSVEKEGCLVAFSGDASHSEEALAHIAKDADIFIAHNAVPENAGRAARNLHMTPSEIGKIAKKAGVKKLVLSHFMRRTEPHKDAALASVRESYRGPVIFAEDLMVIEGR